VKRLYPVRTCQILAVLGSANKDKLCKDKLCKDKLCMDPR